MDGAPLVITYSCGIEEETTVLGVACLTLSPSTERQVTISEGTNRLVDPYDQTAILAAVDEVPAAAMPVGRPRPALWDGHAAECIVRVLAKRAAAHGGRSDTCGRLCWRRTGRSRQRQCGSDSVTVNACWAGEASTMSVFASAPDSAPDSVPDSAPDSVPTFKSTLPLRHAEQ
jgi:UDP-N-acetylglucosamine 2-epimerase